MLGGAEETSPQEYGRLRRYQSNVKNQHQRTTHTQRAECRLRWWENICTRHISAVNSKLCPFWSKICCLLVRIYALCKVQVWLVRGWVCSWHVKHKQTASEPQSETQNFFSFLPFLLPVLRRRITGWTRTTKRSRWREKLAQFLCSAYRCESPSWCIRGQVNWDRKSSRSVDSSLFQEIGQRAKLMIREKGEKSVVRRNVDRNIYFLKSFNFSTQMAGMIGNGANICWQRKRALQVEEKRKKNVQKNSEPKRDGGQILGLTRWHSSCWL